MYTPVHPSLFHRISFEGVLSMVLMSSMMLALTLVRLYSPNSFQLFYQQCHWLSKRTFRVMLLPIVLLANNDYAIDRTGSRSNSSKKVDLSIGFC